MSAGGSEVRHRNYEPCLRGWCLSLRELKAPTGIIQRTTRNSSFNALFCFIYDRVSLVQVGLELVV